MFSAINAASRYYVTAATLLSERTTHIALFSLFQTVGFILGPGIMVSSSLHSVLITNTLSSGCSGLPWIQGLH